MRIVLQRVSSANVVVEGDCVGEIGKGLVALVGVETGDGEEECRFLAQKTVELRIFPDDEGKMNRSLLDISGELLAISQFTLLADWKKGRRPGFKRAAAPEMANKLYEHYVEIVRDKGVSVATGVFAADMKVSLTNDGPVTLVLDTN